MSVNRHFGHFRDDNNLSKWPNVWHFLGQFYPIDLAICSKTETSTCATVFMIS